MQNGVAFYWAKPQHSQDLDNSVHGATARSDVIASVNSFFGCFSPHNAECAVVGKRRASVGSLNFLLFATTEIELFFALP
eukprot:6193858-Pleurochrysis_carterae.AAC.2